MSRFRRVKFERKKMWYKYFRNGREILCVFLVPILSQPNSTRSIPPPPVREESKGGVGPFLLLGVGELPSFPSKPARPTGAQSRTLAPPRCTSNTRPLVDQRPPGGTRSPGGSGGLGSSEGLTLILIQNPHPVHWTVSTLPLPCQRPPTPSTAPSPPRLIHPASGFLIGHEDTSMPGKCLVAQKSLNGVSPLKAWEILQPGGGWPGSLTTK